MLNSIKALFATIKNAILSVFTLNVRTYIGHFGMGAMFAYFIAVVCEVVIALVATVALSTTAGAALSAIVTLAAFLILAAYMVHVIKNTYVKTGAL